MTPDETMFQEALAALEKGEKSRARDLLTRLLKTRQGDADLWLWMSTTVDTPRERIFCLKEVLKIDPNHPAARRGLVMLGALPLDESTPILPRPKARNWPAGFSASLGKDARPPAPWMQIGLYAGGLVALVALVVVIIIFGRLRPTQKAAPVSAPTFVMMATSTVVRQVTPQPTGGPTPLWMMLEATYTPTPLYVNTPHPRTEAFRTGLRAFQRGDWSAAISNMQQVATSEPEAGDVIYYIGESYRFQNKFDQAIESYNQALKINPKFAPALLGRALARLGADSKNANQAKADLEEALNLDPNLFEAYLELANLSIRENDEAQAMKYLDQAKKVNADSPQLYLLRAQVYLAAGETEDALADARHASEMDKTSLPAYRLLGEVLQARGMSADSVEPLTIYTQFVKDDAQAFLWLAGALLAQKDYSEALQAYNQVISLNSASYEAYLGRGQVFTTQKKYDQALNDFDAALRLKTDSYQANISKAQVLMLMGYNGDAYEQFNRTQAYATSDADWAQLYYWRAQSLMALKEVKAAAKDWRALLDLPSKSYPAEWADLARKQLQALNTQTPEISTVTPTAGKGRTITPAKSPISATATVTPRVTATQ